MMQRHFSTDAYRNEALAKIERTVFEYLKSLITMGCKNLTKTYVA